jgi:competence protein ComFC
MRIQHGVVCEPCIEKIELHDGIFCAKCLAPLADVRMRRSGCHPEFPFVLGAAAHYRDATLQTLIHNLKFRSISAASEPLAALLYSYLERTGLDLTSYLVLPIPLSHRRERSRGYNQAELIARNLVRKIAAETKLSIHTDLLHRPKHAKRQSDTKDLDERKSNIRGAFAVANTPAARATIGGAKILLVDDVATSGSTFLEAARVLAAAGAGDILALAVAKT